MYVFEKRLIYRKKKKVLKALKVFGFFFPFHWNHIGFVAFNITSMLYYIYVYYTD